MFVFRVFTCKMLHILGLALPETIVIDLKKCKQARAFPSLHFDKFAADIGWFNCSLKTTAS